VPVVRTPISASQLAELLGVPPERFIAVERRWTPDYKGWVIVLEPEEQVQTTGTCKPLSDNTSRKPKGKGKR
jgi:hypothetical protein